VRKNNDVTSMIIFEALAWIIGGTAALIGFIKWVV
jgi:hypothetical protein